MKGKKSKRRYEENEHIFGKKNILKITKFLGHDKHGRAVYNARNLTTNTDLLALRNRDIDRIANSEKDVLIITVGDEYHTLSDWNKELGLNRHALQDYHRRHDKNVSVTRDRIIELLEKRNDG